MKKLYYKAHTACYKLSIRFLAVLLKQDNDLSLLKMSADKQAVGFDLMKPHCAGEIN